MEAARFPWPALGVLLIRDGLVSREELEEVLALQGDDRERRISSMRLGDVLVERGIVTSAQVARLLAEQHELPFVDLEDSDASVPFAVHMPEELARQHSALPIRVFPDGSLLVVVADPTRTGCFDDIRLALGVPVRFAVAAPEAIEAAIDVASSRALLEGGREAEAVESSDGDTQVEEADAGEPPASLVSEPPDERPRHEAIAPASEPSWPVLGSLLLRDGLVTEEELAAALAQQRLSSTRRLGEILVARGTLAESDVARLLAEQHELPFIELSTYDIDLAAASLLPTDLARVHAALPVARLADGSFVVAVADPTSVMYADELRETLGAPLEFAVAGYGEICEAIERLLEPESPDEPVPSLSNEESAHELEPSEPSASTPSPTPLFVLDSRAETSALSTALTPGSEDEAMRQEEQTPTAAETIEQALTLGATAVHFTPRIEGLVVSARIDGVVNAITTISRSGVAVFANELPHSLVTAAPYSSSAVGGSRRDPHESRRCSVTE